VDGGSFIVRPEWQFIFLARRTEGTSPSDINDVASSRGEDLRNSTGRDRKGERERERERERRWKICHLHVNDVALKYIFNFSYIKESASFSWLMMFKVYF